MHLLLLLGTHSRLCLYSHVAGFVWVFFLWRAVLFVPRGRQVGPFGGASGCVCGVCGRRWPWHAPPWLVCLALHRQVCRSVFAWGMFMPTDTLIVALRASVCEGSGFSHRLLTKVKTLEADQAARYRQPTSHSVWS